MKVNSYIGQMKRRADRTTELEWTSTVLKAAMRNLGTK